LLGCNEDTEPLPPADIADALGEIANMVAGGIKRRMAKHDSSIKLGLPFFLHGRIEPLAKQETAITEAMIGPVTAQLLLIKQVQATKS